MPTDITETLAAKADQLTAAAMDASGPIRVKITSAHYKKQPQQPVTIKLDGRLPFKPCLTMRRILAEAWGHDCDQWAGREMRLYCDDSVTFGDEESGKLEKVGGVRISHLSHIKGTLRIRLTSTRGKTKTWVIEPLEAANAPAWTLGQIHPSWEADQPAFTADLAALGLTVEKVDQYLQSEDGAGFRKWWNGGDCAALGCSWVPTRWRAGLTDALKKKPELVAKIAALTPSEQGN